MKNTIRRFYNQHIRHDLFFTIITASFMLFCIASCIYFAVCSIVRNALMCLFFAVMPFVIILIECLLCIVLPPIFLLLVYFLMLGGGMLGPCYNMYFIVPEWDDLLHCTSGIIFALLGFALVDRTLEKRNVKCFALSLFGGIFFSLAIATLWEMFEYAGTALLGFDMQEDCIIHGFNSYLLSGTHNEVVQVDGIVQTVIHFGNGQQLVIDGFLDIGLKDTLDDMLMCTIGCIVYAAVIPLAHKFSENIENKIVPEYVRLQNSYNNDTYALPDQDKNLTAQL